jgi:type IV secretion system protein VirB6
MSSSPTIMSIFTTMYGYVETAISTSVANFGSGLVSFVAAPLGVAATIYFLLLGFAVLRGAIQAPLRELVFQAGKVGFAIAAASAVGYSAFVVNVATNLPAEIIAAGSGTAISNPGTTFDEYASDAGKLAKIMDAQNATVQTLTIGGTLDFQLPLRQLRAALLTYACIGILYTLAFLSAAVGFCIVIFAKLSVAICIALAPLALGSLLFNSSRWLFDGWLKQTANYILLMVVMTIMTKFITGLEVAAMDGIIGTLGDGAAFLSGTGTEVDLKAGAMIIATIACAAIYLVGTIFFFQSPAIAAGIAGGASSGGHGFLQTGGNLIANKLIFRRLATPIAPNGPSSKGPSGGSATRR